ncbi:ndufa8, NADH-ubiquinone oxidoreductase complex I 19kd subunit [Rhizina undulata]
MRLQTSPASGLRKYSLVITGGFRNVCSLVPAPNLRNYCPSISATAPSSYAVAMSTSREATFSQKVLIDTTPLPDSIPKVQEVGATSGPLMSASFFIGDRCKEYNEDYMLCKHEAKGRGELECMKEGRRVTRCAASVIADINKYCLNEFKAHWECLDQHNQQMWHCRAQEKPYNKCVFNNLVGLPSHIFSNRSRPISLSR